MDDLEVTVIVPVGPRENHTRWLPQCLDSISNQRLYDWCAHDEPLLSINLLLIDDAPQLRREFFINYRMRRRFGDIGIGVEVHTNPWPLGDSASFNIGVGLCETPFFFFLSCDDWLEPDCLARCAEAYALNPDPLGMYWPVINNVSVDGALVDTMNLPCTHSMISTRLWKHLGGTPPQAGIGHGDTFFMTIMTQHFSEHMHPVEPKVGLYNYRAHEQQASAHDGGYFGLIQEARRIYTLGWKPMEWHA